MKRNKMEKVNIELMFGRTKLDTVEYYGNIFDKRSNKYNLKIDFSKCLKVKNEVRCYITYDKIKQELVQSLSQNGVATIKIALIVESPHKDEFTYDFQPIRPLNGKSGNVFDEKVLKKMHHWFRCNIDENKQYEIKILNPVQYQASLYHFLNNLDSKNSLPMSITVSYGSLQEYNNQKLKNDVWKILFEKICKTNFEQELKNYCPDYIVNCCTGNDNNFEARWYSCDQLEDYINSAEGNKCDTLKTETRKSICKVISKTHICYREDIHPIKW